MVGKEKREGSAGEGRGREEREEKGGGFDQKTLYLHDEIFEKNK